jgi:hypothetical protein
MGDGTMRDEWNLIHAYKSWYCTLHYTNGLNKAEASRLQPYSFRDVYICLQRAGS